MLTCKKTQQQAQRDPDEEGDYMAFEQLMADAQLKKDKKKDKKDAAGKKEDAGVTHANPQQQQPPPPPPRPTPQAHT